MRPLLLAAVVLAGCGGRSALVELEPHASEAPPGPCEPLSLTGPVVSLPDIPGVEALRPALAPLAGGPESMLVFSERSLGTPDTSATIGGLAFDPWGAWPPALPDPHTVSTAGGAAFAIGGSDQPTYGILTAPTAPMQSCSFAGSVGPTESAGLLQLGAWSLLGAPRFLVPHATRPLGGIDGVWGPAPQSHLFTSFLLDGSVIWTLVATCGLGPLAGDAIALGGGYLAALATSASNPGCALDDAKKFPVELPTHVRLASFGPFSGDVPETSDIPLSAPIGDVHLVPEAGGAWLAVQTRGDDEERGPIELRRLDAQRNVVADLGQVVTGARIGFTAAPLGEGFALAWIDPGDAIGVAAFDAAGARIAETRVPVSAAPEEPIAMLGAGDASGVVLAWSEVNADQRAGVRLARLGCLTPSP